MNGEEKSKLDTLNEELYYRKYPRAQQHERRKLHDQNIELPKDFEDDSFDELKKKSPRYTLPASLFQRLFFFALALFLVSALVAFTKFYRGKQRISNDLIYMELVGQPFVDGGEELELLARIQNFNEESLELPDLVITYPKDNENSDQGVIRRSLPNIKKGDRVEEKFYIPILGQEGDVRNIQASLEYRVKGSNAIFVREAKHKVIIRSTPTQIIVTAPEKVIHGQEVLVDLDIHPNTEKRIQNFLVRVEYPLGFEFIAAEPEPRFGNGTWYFGTLPPEGEKIRIKGKVKSFPGEMDSLHIYAGKQNPTNPTEIETTYNHIVHTMEIEEPFLLVRMFINGKRNPFVPVRGDRSIDGEIQYENTLDVPLRDVQLTLYLDGDMYRPDKVRAMGAEYDSSRMRIVWTKDTYNHFKELKPHETGTLSFSLYTKPFYSAEEVLRNPKTDLSISVSGIDEGGTIREARAIERTELRGITEFFLIGKTLSSEGPFQNAGPIPPRVGQKTQYTLKFQVVNSSNKVKEAHLKTVLPVYVRWTGKVYPSREKEKIRYSAATGEFLWDIGDVESGVGVGGSKAKELLIQIEATPSLSHVDQPFELTRDLYLRGVDEFTDVSLEFKKPPLKSILADSPKTRDGIVQN